MSDVSMSSINKLNASIETLKTAIEEYSLAVEKKIEELKQAKRIAENTVAISKEEQVKIQGKIQETENAKNNTEKELEQLKTEFSDIFEENVDALKRIMDLTDDLELKDQELKNSANELKGKQKTIDDLITDIKSKQTEVDSLNDKLDEAIRDKEMSQAIDEYSIVQKDAKIDELQKELNAKEIVLNEEINKLNEENVSLNGLLDKMEEELRKTIEKSTLAEKQQIEQFSELAGVIEKQTEELKEVSAKITTMETTIDSLEKTKSELETQHSGCQSKINELNAQIEAANAKIQELQSLIVGKTTGLNEPEEKFGIDITGVSPEPVIYTEPILVEENGITKMRLKDASGKFSDFPYDAERKLPKDDLDGSITGYITKWSKTIRPDGSPVYTKEMTKKNNPNDKPVKNFTVKGGRKRKSTKTIKRRRTLSKVKKSKKSSTKKMHRR